MSGGDHGGGDDAAASTVEAVVAAVGAEKLRRAAAAAKATVARVNDGGGVKLMAAAGAAGQEGPFTRFRVKVSAPHLPLRRAVAVAKVAAAMEAARHGRRASRTRGSPRRFFTGDGSDDGGDISVVEVLRALCAWDSANHDESR